MAKSNAILNEEKIKGIEKLELHAVKKRLTSIEIKLDQFETDIKQKVRINTKENNKQGKQQASQNSIRNKNLVIYHSYESIKLSIKAKFKDVDTDTVNSLLETIQSKRQS